MAATWSSQRDSGGLEGNTAGSPVSSTPRRTQASLDALCVQFHQSISKCTKISTKRRPAVVHQSINNKPCIENRSKVGLKSTSKLRSLPNLLLQKVSFLLGMVQPTGESPIPLWNFPHGGIPR